MELMEKQGYKQTEVGLIPEDWNDESIGDLASISTGGSDTQDRVDDGIYPFFVRSQTIERINKYSFDGEAILTSGDGVGVGKIFHYVNCKFDYHQRVYNIHNYRKDVSGKYLFYQFSTKFYDRVMAMTAKSSVDSVRREMIADMKIPLPPTLAEQKAIATALSDVDELITNLDQLITKKKAIKQGAMQQLLTPPHKGGKRLDGFTGEWEEKTLGELFDFKTTTTKKQFFDLSGNLIVMDMGSVSIDGKILRSKKASCDFDILKKGDLVMPKDDIGGGNIIGKVAYIDKDNSYVLSDHVFRLNSINDKINSLYFYYLINSRIVNESILKVVSGSAQLGLGLNAIKKITVCYNSDKSQQKAIAQILSDMDLEIERLETKKEKFQYIKLGMMQELLTGKTRLV